MWNTIKLLLLVLLFPSLSFAQPSTTLVASSVSDDDTTIYNPDNIGFAGATVTQNGAGALVTITGGGGGGSGDVTAVGNCATGACFTGSSGTTLTSTTSEVLDLSTDGSLIFQRDDSGNVTFMGKDNSDPVNTFYDTSGAGSIVIGSADVAAVTVSTDSTGTAEVVLPAGSIDGTEILDNTVVLTTDTAGNYADGDAEAGSALAGDSATAFFSTGQIEAARGGTGDDTSATTGISRVDSGNWTYAELSGDVVTSASNATIIQADSVALGTDTTGNYATSSSEGGDATGLTCTDCVNATEIEDIYLLNSGDNSTGVLTFTAGTGIDTNSAGLLKIGTTTAAAITIGNTTVTSVTVSSDSVGDAEIVLPDSSIGASELGTDSVSADELNATGVEAELESALDIGGEVTSTGMASTVIADSISVTSWSLTTPNILSKYDLNNTAVDDDDCTGEQGIGWYDTTDSAWEFCNANSGTPTTLGGGSDTSGWEDDGTEIRLDTSTDEVEIGSAATLSAKLAINGDTDETQFLLQGNNAQSSNVNLITIEDYQATDLFNFENDGSFVVSGDSTQSTIKEGLVVNNQRGSNADDDFLVRGSSANNLFLVAVSSDTVTSAATGSLGWSIVDGTDNTACTAQCNFAAVMGFNITAGNITGLPLGPADATADMCLCAGGS